MTPRPDHLQSTLNPSHSASSVQPVLFSQFCHDTQPLRPQRLCGGLSSQALQYHGVAAIDSAYPLCAGRVCWPSVLADPTERIDPACIRPRPSTNRTSRPLSTGSPCRPEALIDGPLSTGGPEPSPKLSVRTGSLVMPITAAEATAPCIRAGLNIMAAASTIGATLWLQAVSDNASLWLAHWMYHLDDSFQP